MKLGKRKKRSIEMNRFLNQQKLNWYEKIVVPPFAFPYSFTTTCVPSLQCLNSGV